MNKAAALLVAYMTQEPVEESLQEARDYVIQYGTMYPGTVYRVLVTHCLRESPRLLDIMVDMAQSKALFTVLVFGE